jgi:hypothetical protein
LILQFASVNRCERPQSASDASLSGQIYRDVGSKTIDLMMSQYISRGKGLGTDAFTDAKWLKIDANQIYRETAT